LKATDTGGHGLCIIGRTVADSGMARVSRCDGCATSDRAKPVKKRARFLVLGALCGALVWLPGCVTHSFWTLVKPPLIDRFEVRAPEGPDTNHLQWRALAKTAVNSREIESGQLELSPPPRSCSTIGYIAFPRSGYEPLIDEATGERRTVSVYTRSARARGYRLMVGEFGVKECDNLLAVLHYEDTNTTSRIVLTADAEERGRADVRQSKIPFPTTWPVFIVTGAVDLVTLPIQAIWFVLKMQ
jgi:hypothetical protein